MVVVGVGGHLVMVFAVVLVVAVAVAVAVVAAAVAEAVWWSDTARSWRFSSVNAAQLGHTAPPCMRIDSFCGAAGGGARLVQSLSHSIRSAAVGQGCQLS